LQHHFDDKLVEEIARELAACIPRESIIVCQLSIGSHVDHVLVRRAAESLGRPLLYTADIPYLFSFGGEVVTKTAGLRCKAYGISGGGFGAWVRAAEAYASQIPSLFRSDDAMREALRGYWSGRRGIEVWST
jgi:hypothetical protein